MRIRRVLGCAVALAAVATPATAAPKGGCAHLVSDPRGDAGPVPADYDIVSGNLVLGRTTLVGVLTVAGRDAASPAHVAGGEWRLSATRAGVDVVLTAQRAAGAAGTYTGSARVGGGAVPVVLRAAGTSLVWTVDAAHLRGMTKPKTFWANAAARTRVAGAVGDDASGSGCRSRRGA